MTWLVGLGLSAVLVPATGPVMAQDMDDALVIEVDLPSTLSCGQRYEASVTMLNTGATTWTEGGGYRLGPVDDGDDLSGPDRVFLPDGLSVGPGESYMFAIPLTAPTTAGRYRTDWQMLREEVAWFGQTAVRDVEVDCPPPGVDDAMVIEVDLPSTLSCGQSYPARVTMQNTGTTTWTEAEGIRLGAIGNSDELGGPGRIYLPGGLSVSPNERYSFSMTLTAPMTPGTYVTDWRMLRESVAWFGQTAARQVEVDCPPPGVDDAIAIEVDLPSTLSCGQSYPARVTMQNTGTTTWTEAEGIRLGAVGNSDDLGGPGRIYLPDGLSVSPNERYSFSMTLTAPMTPGTYVTDWRMLREGVAWFGQTAARQVEVDCPPPGVDDAIAIEVDLPSTLSCGQSYPARVTMQNTGTTTWTEAEGMRLGAVGGSNDLGGPGRISLPGGLSVSPNEAHTFSMTLTAPMTPGTYVTDWRMLREGVAWFGQAAARDVQVDCPAPGIDDAMVIEVDLPSSLSCGQSYAARVTMQNTGTTTWTEGEAVRLGAIGNSDDLGGPGRVNLPDGLIVSPNEGYAFSMTLTAPTTPGTYVTDWQMLREGVAWFGQAAAREVQVDCPAPGIDDAMVIEVDLPSSLSCGQSYAARVTMQNTGTTTWTEGEAVRLGAIGNSDDLGGPGRVNLPDGLSVLPNEGYAFSMTLTAPTTPGTYVTDWQMLREGVAWFGQAAAQNVVVSCEPTFNGARIVSVSRPDLMAPGSTAEVSITVENTGSTPWDASTYSLGAVGEEITWGLNRVPVDAPVEPGHQKVFTFTIMAPSTAGLYDFHWRMVQELVEWFGESTVDQRIVVWSGFNSAAFVSQSGVPADLVAGQTATVSVTMENTGTTTWDSTAGYFLGSINPYNNQVWGLARVPLDHPVAPLERITFTYTITAPSTPGPHVFQWQMVQELVEWFGTPTPSSVIVVGSPDDMAIPVGHTIPETVTSGTLYLITVTMQNTGGSTWSRDGDGPPDGSQGYKLAVKSGALLPVGMRIPMTFGDEAAPGEAYTFVTTLVPEAGLSFASVEFQMIHEGSGWFGESLRVGVAIDGAEGDCGVNLDPPSGPPGTLVTIAPAGCTFEADSRVAFSFGDPQQHAYSRVPVSYAWLGPTQITFIVPSDADCGSHYATVRVRDGEPRERRVQSTLRERRVQSTLRERRVQSTLPAEFEVTGPCDPSRRNAFDVLSYNVHLLPILDDSDGYRAGLVASHPELKGHDAIVFVEAIDDNRWTLIHGLRQDYPYVTPVIPASGHDYNGGVFIMSKWPIDVQLPYVFQHCHGDIPTNPPDCIAAKGVNYARINKAGQPYHLLGTHFDAGFEPGDYFARKQQTNEMAALYFGAQAEQPVIMAGDFNIDKISPDPARQVEYAYLLDTLRVTAPSDPPYPPDQGTLPNGEWLDFVFYSNAHLLPRESYNYVVKPRDGGGGDLSDHYAVLGRFRFVPPGGPGQSSIGPGRRAGWREVR